MIILGRIAILAAIFGFFLSFSNAYVYAQDTHKKLTRQNIKSFIKDTTALTSGKKKDISDEDITRYLEAHLDKDARFKSDVRFTLPGFPPQNRSLALNKEEFIAQTLSGEQALDDYNNKVKVGKIKVSKNGRRATVATTGVETGTMDVPNGSGQTERVPVEGMTSCDQILKLSKGGVIQMYNANCKTEIIFEQF